MRGKTWAGGVRTIKGRRRKRVRERGGGHDIVVFFSCVSETIWANVQLFFGRPKQSIGRAGRQKGGRAGQDVGGRRAGDQGNVGKAGERAGEWA